MSQFQVRTGPIQNDVAPFSMEMSQGCLPQRGRPSQGKQTRLDFAQTIPVLVIDPPQFQGPSRANDPIPTSRHGRQSCFVVIASVCPDVFPNVYPDTSRVKLGPRIALPYTDNTVAANSAEMFQGNIPTAARIKIAPRLPLPFFGWVDPIVSPDQFAGNCPTSPRIKLGPRIPLPISQTTHTAAAFSPEMILGSAPQRNRVVLGKQLGRAIMDNTTVATASVTTGGGSVFSVGIGDMVSDSISIGEF